TPTFQPVLRDSISPPWLEYIVVFIGTFLLVFIPLSILSHRLSEAVQKSEIGPVDRALGFAFGVGRGLVIVGVAYIAFAALVPLPAPRDSVTRARLYPWVRETSEVLLGFIPGQRSGVAGLEARAAAPRAAAPAAAPPNDSGDSAKTYGQNDRRALDRLIETTG